MIQVQVHEDGRRVALTSDCFAELVVGAVAAEYAEDPEGVGATLEQIEHQRRIWEGLASHAGTREVPERLINEAAAAWDATREHFVTTFAEPVVLALTERQARSLAGALTRTANHLAERRRSAEGPT